MIAVSVVCRGVSKGLVGEGLENEFDLTSCRKHRIIHTTRVFRRFQIAADVQKALDSTSRVLRDSFAIRNCWMRPHLQSSNSPPQTLVAIRFQNIRRLGV